MRVFGAAYPHHAYLFANERTNRLKVLVYDSAGDNSGHDHHPLSRGSTSPLAFER